MENDEIKLKASVYSFPGMGIATPEDIIKLVEQETQTPRGEIFIKSRKGEVIWIRQLAATLIHLFIAQPLRETGMVVGGFDHATVLNSVNAIDRYMYDKNSDRYKIIYRCMHAMYLNHLSVIKSKLSFDEIKTLEKRQSKVEMIMQFKEERKLNDVLN